MRLLYRGFFLIRLRTDSATVAPFGVDASRGLFVGFRFCRGRQRGERSENSCHVRDTNLALLFFRLPAKLLQFGLR